MSDKITDLTSLSSGAVDRATDVLEIADTSASTSKKITPNALMGISGNAVGDTDTQTLTEKTITAPNISSPVLSGTLTGTYTIGGTPTFPSSVVTLTGSQTLTNKVLTSPTINTATITNPTLTVDTVSEFTSANGVSIDGLNIKDGKLNTNNSVVTTNITDASLTNAKLSTTVGELGGSWGTWTPAWGGGMTIGNAVVSARYYRSGKLVVCHIEVTGGTTSSSAGGTVPTYTLPITSRSYGLQFPLGQFILRGAIVGSGYTRFSSTTTGDLAAYQVSGANIIDAGIHEAFGNGDRLLINCTYEAA